MLIEFHRNMLADTTRNEAFYRALAKVIVPGKSVVADLGSGTGFLGFLALKLGAKAVYFYEYSPAIKLSEKLARANQIKGCHFVHDHSTQVKNPVAADIIVSETFGNYAYEENIIENIEDARRFLKPGGTLIPGRLEQFVAPITSPRFLQELQVWDDVGYGLDFTLAKQMSLNNLYVRKISAADLFSGADSAQCWDVVDFTKPGNKSKRRGHARWRVDTRVTFYGFALWWRSELVPGIDLSIHPAAPNTHWEQLFLPVTSPLELDTNEELKIEIHSDTRYEIGVNVTWIITVSDTRQNVRVQQKLDMRLGDVR
ncbi:MAG: 50S ribosomal protein L11 methyltransferase [Gammaproteobacteria bacterium]|nr:50S ribosomal protein L11 methyltransferase [Gammaproteobacteria bacterium]